MYLLTDGGCAHFTGLLLDYWKRRRTATRRPLKGGRTDDILVSAATTNTMKTHRQPSTTPTGSHCSGWNHLRCSVPRGATPIITEICKSVANTENVSNAHDPSQLCVLRYRIIHREEFLPENVAKGLFQAIYWRTGKVSGGGGAGGWLQILQPSHRDGRHRTVE